MRFGLAFLLLIAAVALSGWGVMPQWRERKMIARLAHITPATADRSRGADAKYIDALYRILSAIDPSFAGSAASLRSLGLVSLSWILVLQIGKVLAALSCALIAATIAARLIHYAFAGWIALLLSVPISMMGFNAAIKNASTARLRRIRSELALGIEFLCIFLEGGQTLDQAFRSFSDICTHALPRIAGPQHALVADFNNGMPYEKALQRWAGHLNVEEAAILAPLLTESLVHGTELVPTLRQFAVDLVERRIQTARAGIGVKAVQLNVIMVLFFLPAILTFIAAPAVTGLTLTLGQAK